MVFGAGAAAVWVPVASPGSGFPAWPAWALTVLTGASLYICFASLLGLWPARNAGSQGRGPGATAEDGGQRMSRSIGSIQVGPQGRVKTGDIFIMNSQSLNGGNEVTEDPKD